MINNINELERVRGECRKLVTRRSLASAAVTAIPIPGPDVATDLAVLMEMLPKINRKFGLSPDQIDDLDMHTKGRIAAIAASLGSSFIGKTITKEAVSLVFKKVGLRVAAKSTAKYVPIIGTAVATTISFAAMKWIGDSHIDDCYSAVKHIIDAGDASGAEVHQ